MCKQGCQGISQTGISQNRIFPILDKASSLPSGWNFAGSTTALKAIHNPIVEKKSEVGKY